MEREPSATPEPRPLRLRRFPFPPLQTFGVARGRPLFCSPGWPAVPAPHREAARKRGPASSRRRWEGQAQPEGTGGWVGGRRHGSLPGPPRTPGSEGEASCCRGPGGGAGDMPPMAQPLRFASRAALLAHKAEPALGGGSLASDPPATVPLPSRRARGALDGLEPSRKQLLDSERR